jgi:hypothetical protein
MNETQYISLKTKKIFYGRNITLFNGKIICGIKEHLSMFMLIIIISFILSTVWGYFVFTFYIFNDILYFPIIQYISFLSAFYHYVKCFMTEPGIIPRNCDLINIDNTVESHNEHKRILIKDTSRISLDTISLKKDRYIINYIVCLKVQQIFKIRVKLILIFLEYIRKLISFKFN